MNVRIHHSSSSSEQIWAASGQTLEASEQVLEASGQALKASGQALQASEQVAAPFYVMRLRAVGGEGTGGGV